MTLRQAVLMALGFGTGSMFVPIIYDGFTSLELDDAQRRKLGLFMLSGAAVAGIWWWFDLDERWLSAEKATEHVVGQGRQEIVGGGR